MIEATLKQFRERAKSRPKGYAEELADRACFAGDKLYLDESDDRWLRDWLAQQRFEQTQWPRWATTVRTFAAKTDKGVGDTIERLLGKAGRGIKRLFAALGRDCGCVRRKQELNQLYPYARQPAEMAGIGQPESLPE